MIKDAVSKRPGDEAVQCDGICTTWVHCCTSLSSVHLFCTQVLYRLDELELELSSLSVMVTNQSSSSQ